MKLVIALCSFMVAASAAPAAESDADAKVIYSENDHGIGNYRFAFIQSNGLSAQAIGEIKNAGEGKESLSVSGSFSWEAPNGVVYTVTYTADENGYKPKIEEGSYSTPIPPVEFAAPPAVVATLLG